MTHKCHWCGKLFTRRGTIARHCSRACAGQARRRRVVNVCSRCGESFEFRPSQLRSYPGAGQFCSRACAERGPIGACAICGSEFQGYRDNQRYCSESCARKFYLLFDDVERRAWSLGANIVMEDRRRFFTGLLSAALDTPCPYCGDLLTLTSASLDHKIPTNHRARKGQSLAVRRELDRPENLHIVCRDCNGMKGNMTDDEFRTLLAFFAEHPNLGEKVSRRLKQSITLWTEKRRKVSA